MTCRSFDCGGREIAPHNKLLDSTDYAERCPSNPIFIHRALLDCDVETMANQVHYFYCSFLGIYEDPDLLANIIH